MLLPSMHDDACRAWAEAGPCFISLHFTRVAPSYTNINLKVTYIKTSTAPGHFTETRRTRAARYNSIQAIRKTHSSKIRLYTAHHDRRCFIFVKFLNQFPLIALRLGSSSTPYLFKISSFSRRCSTNLLCFASNSRFSASTICC